MTIPSILVGGVSPPPQGASANAYLALNATGIAVTLATTVGIGSIQYILTSPSGSTCALGNATPSAPFFTTIGPFDKRGSYTLTAIANGDPKQSATVLLAVKTPVRGLRLPSFAEGYFYDLVLAWWQAMADLFDAADSPDTPSQTSTLGLGTSTPVQSLVVSAQTTTNTPVTPTLFSPTVPGTYTVTGLIESGHASSNDGYSISFNAVFRYYGGALSQVGATQYGTALNTAGATNAAPTVGFSGGNIIATINGIAATTINWTVAATVTMRQ